MPGIELRGISRQFGSAVAVDHIDLQVRDGEFLTLLGPSGCGKTTTLRMVAGLERNDTGTIAIGDRVVSDAGRRMWAAPEQREIGMVFQSYAIWPHMTVFDNVAFPLQVRKRGKEEIRDKVMATLKLVEMERFADRPAPALSGGQQQRVAIARALAFEPQVLLMDEPLSNLDAKLREQMRTELRSIQRKLGITTLYVTHDQEEAITLSDRIVVMSGGKILQVDSPEVIFERPRTQGVATFFGSPVMVAAQVESVQAGANGAVRARVRGQDWQGEVQAAEGTAVGQRVALVLRSDVLGLGPAQGAGPSWPGKVRLQIYRGSRRSVLVDTAVGCLTIDVDTDTQVAEGEMVVVRVDGRRIWAVPSDDAPAQEGVA